MPVPTGLPEVLLPELPPGCPGTPEMYPPGWLPPPPGTPEEEANGTGDSQQEEAHAAALEEAQQSEAKKQMGTPKCFKSKYRLVAN